jgi:glycine oxidase
VSSVLIIGGGVIGCAAALALARRGLRAIVLERGTTRLEAPGETGASSWAAAGILGAQIAAHEDGPFARLCIAARERYPAFVTAVHALTGLDVELRPAGVLRPAFTADDLAAVAAEVAWQEAAGLRVEHLDASQARAIEPALSPDVAGAVRFPDDPRIDPPALLAALRTAVDRAGGELRTGAEVRRVLVRGGRAHGVELTSGDTLAADAIVVAAGSWSSLVEGASLPAESVTPARGQIVELRLPQQILRGVVEGAAAYLSPRDDGRILVGSTVEQAGYAKGVTAAAVRDLLAGAIHLVPALAGATVARVWSGFRPCTRDELPLLGLTGVEGLVVATGHFRNGVLLAPLTGDIVAALVLGEAPPHDVATFSPGRLQEQRTG